MNRIEIPVVFTDEDALKAMQLPGEMLDEMLPMIRATRAAANPKAYYGAVPVDGADETGATVGGVRMKSRVLSVNLMEQKMVVPYVCTCGTELAALSDALADPMERYFQDALNEMVLRLAMEAFREQVSKEFALEPLYAMSPGSLADWPLPEQGPLFRLLGDVTAQIGVELTHDFLMLPIKSVSGIFFSAEQEYVNCMLCEMARCPNRRAEYNPELYERRFASNMAAL